MSTATATPVANVNGPLKVLTAAQITAKLGNVRKRGIHPEAVTRFIVSGELYTVLNESNADYKNLDSDKLKGMVQGLTGAYKNIRQKALINNVTTTPEVKVMFDEAEGNLYLINVTALEAQAD